MEQIARSTATMNPFGEPSTAKGRGRVIWRQGQDHKELRRPQTENRTDVAVIHNSAQPDPCVEGDISVTSTLSANAKEFYPPNYQSQQSKDSYNSSSQYEEVPRQNVLPFQTPVVPNSSLGQGYLEGIRYSNWSPVAPYLVFKPTPVTGGGPHHNSSNPASENKEELITTNHLIEVMQHLTVHPGKFDVLITPLVDTFSCWLGDEDKVSYIVNAIVEQSITEPNFRYNGARFCSFLNNEFPPGERSTFRAYLLNRCKEEHVQISNYIHTHPRRLHGFVLFMAELFMQLECAKGYGERITILGTALVEDLSLLITEPTSENIKCTCQVLKLAGQPLDVQEPVIMNEVMESLLHLLNNPMVESNVRHLISSVFELRRAGWGDASGFMPNTSTTQPSNPCLQNYPVFYGPDGQIMTPEESQFLEESVGRIPDSEEYDDCSEDGDIVWEPDDEMDEEIQAAFEQFLNLGKN
ncbi:polyadenylate-binding protein-interacting protein 1 isoform X1 [Zootermopsis nevadensis]|uniref:polyadenylate-binding protein-interacting protein 1 isoform X1 n=1 Tax=Zootermopsis nevadensis TaxID=136037 RepID=UPI000B8E76E5|nr:polyadenylate-binding protein-interacting protein 1 isoform X1 [Zootermopsis nevadensis]